MHFMLHFFGISFRSKKASGNRQSFPYTEMPFSCRPDKQKKHAQRTVNFILSLQNFTSLNIIFQQLSNMEQISTMNEMAEEISPFNNYLVLSFHDLNC